MATNFKSDKFVEVLQEFLIVQGQTTYAIGSIVLTDVYFFVKNGNNNYSILSSGQYQVVGTNLIINDPLVIKNNTNIQVCRVLNTTASKYISDIVNINTLRDHYNTLVDDFIKIIDFLRKSGIKSDSSSMNYIFPLLEEGQVFMKKGLGFEGKQVMDIDAELQAQIDKAYAFFEQYVNNEKKPELDAYTVSKKQELETYTIAKKGEINTLVTGHKADINTLADTKKTEIIELGNLKQQEIISLSTGKIKEITDVTTVKKQEIETLTAQKKVQITDHTDLEIQKILSLGIDGLQAQIDANKSDILLKLDKSGGKIDGNLIIKSNENTSFTLTGQGECDVQILPLDSNDQGSPESQWQIGTTFNKKDLYFFNGKTGYITTIKTDGSIMTKTNKDVFDTGNCTIARSKEGWCKLVNGLIIQWGTTAVNKVWSSDAEYYTVAFPIAFTSYTNVSIASLNFAGNVCPILCALGEGTTAFSLYKDARSSTNFTTHYVKWIAIGV